MNTELGINQEANSGQIAALPKLGYSVREAEKITGLGRTTLWKAIDEGRLKCFRVGRRVLFSEDHLRSFLASYEQPGAHKSR
jgi:excisionase family DNA binding protein